jgi:hypothetical protein
LVPNISLRELNKRIPKGFQERLQQERRQARAAAKKFAEACRPGDLGLFFGAYEHFRYLPDGWTFAFREVGRLKRVDEKIQSEFQLLWFDGKIGWQCDDKNALLDALRVLFPRYRGSAVRLFRGASAREGRARRLYGPSWSTEIETADGFAQQYRTALGGSVVLETKAPAKAIIFAPGFAGPFWEGTDGRRRYDESEYLVDGRRLGRVTVARRYPQISLDV